jgi:ketopantoate reductase
MTAMPDALVMGLGQLGQMYAGALLRLGFRVTPIVRSTARPLQLGVPPGTPVLLAVGEEQFDDAVKELQSAQWADHLILLQNEIFPASWKQWGVENPTVMAVWTNRKNGAAQVGLATRVSGPQADLVMRMHQALNIPCEKLTDESALNTELCAKYAFILTLNALGVAQARTVSHWMQAEPGRVRAVLNDAVALSAARVDGYVDVARASARAREALEALSNLPTLGRTALPRVERAAHAARTLQMDLPALRALLPSHFGG